MAIQKELENKARKAARKQVKKFLESEQLMTLQKEEKPERKLDMEELFGKETPKQKDNEDQMTFEKETYQEKMEALKKLLYDTKPTNPKPVEYADEGTDLPADMTFAKVEREDNKSELDKLFNTDTDKIDVSSVNYETLSAEDFADILGESKMKILEDDEDIDIDIDEDEKEDEEKPEKDEDKPDLPEESEEEEPEKTEEPEEEPEEPEEKEEKVSGVVISDDMLDELVDRILDKFDELGLVVLSVDDDDLDKLSNEIEDKIRDKANVLSDDELEETINYQVKNALDRYKILNESLLKRRWEKFVREMENGEMEPSKIGEIKEHKLLHEIKKSHNTKKYKLLHEIKKSHNTKKHKSPLKEQLDKLDVSTKISSVKESKSNNLFNDDTIKMLLEEE